LWPGDISPVEQQLRRTLVRLRRCAAMRDLVVFMVTASWLINGLTIIALVRNHLEMQKKLHMALQDGAIKHWKELFYPAKLKTT
jgi:hypothetical protein